VTSSTPPIQLTTRRAAETESLGGRLARILQPGDVVALCGQLGAGKTQLVRGLAAALGADPRAVSSPTFVLMQEYGANPPVLHIDAYRIETLDELESLGWSSELADESVSVIEWAERIAEELPADRLDVRLEHTGAETRAVEIRPRGRFAERVSALREALALDAAPSASDEPAGPRTPCPICKTPVGPDAEMYPFCSARCRTIDLGRWLGGHYRMPREIDYEADDLSTFDQEAGE